MTVVTRFAPSPTGFLHIGGARTALFNWLFAKHHGGQFLLRIEDTDRKRSNPEAVDAILDGMSWLGLNWDGDAISQFEGRERHAAAALKLLEEGKAYKCYCTPEELTEMRETAKAEGRSIRYDGRWRDRDPSDAPAGIDPVIRLKAPQTGETVISDLIQGDVRVGNEQLDDMVLLRGDGTPTYMLAVVVDDHDMAVTHIIRGDDHLTNAFRQYQLYAALGWDMPEFAHQSLIHGSDGKKLSKRHGAVAVQLYRDLGYLPEAIRNYLVRLGWSHGDEEIITTDQAIEWFGLDAVGRSAARFDFDKLASLNSHYINESNDRDLTNHVKARLPDILGHDVEDAVSERIVKAMPQLKSRAKTLVELAESAAFFARRRPLSMNDKAKKLLDEQGLATISELRAALANVDAWSVDALESLARDFAEAKSLKLGKVAQPLRAALTGSNASPPIFDVIEVLGREETLGRLDDVL